MIPSKFNKYEERELVILPQSQEDLDQFVEQVCHEAGTNVCNEAYEAIATSILHADNTSATFSKTYFVNRLQKAVANRTAYDKLQKLNEQRKQEETLKASKASEVTSSGSGPV